MYKCTICNKEYETKPDFCDCGNDEFEGFDEEKKEISTPKITEQKNSSKPSCKMEKGDIISIIIFLTCIIFSLWFLFFFGVGGDKTEYAPEIKSNTNEVKTMPDINSIWDDTPNKIVLVQPVQVANPKEVKTSVIKPKQSAPVSKPKAQNKTAPINPQPSSKQVSAPIQTPPVQTVLQKPQPIDLQAQKQELKTYKIALRNKIAQGINFASVAGDGKCSVSFSISESGYLVGRKFSQLSQNDMLNQAVFQALSNVNYFSQPPALYKGETLTLTVSFYDGNFSVALP